MTQETKQQIAEAYLRLGTYEKVRKEIGYSPATISKVLKEYNLGRGKGGNQDKQRKVTDEQILEDIALGLTRQEIADKRGVHVANLDRRMRNLGKYAKHKTPIREEKAKDWHWTAGGAAFVEKYQGEHFDFVSYMNGRYRLKCKKCGAVVERAKSTVRCKNVECEECKKIEKMKADIMPYLRISEELKKTKICAHCGNGFHSQYPTALYCSSECRRKARRKRHPPKKDPCNKIRKRCKKYGVEYKTGISLSRLYNRDNGICQICGKPVNWGDNTWGEHFGPQYPTIDHIVALSNGGAHTWENVQLAHAICNSYKRNLPCGALETMLFPIVEGREQSA